MLEGLKKSPVIYLSARVWKYSQGNHRTVAMYVLMSATAAIVSLAQPVILTFIFNQMQVEGISARTLPHLLGLLSLLVVREVLAWSFHGTSRIMEIENAFKVRSQYRQHLLDGVLGLPIEWHTGHHSGDTIDKVQRGSSRLSDYSETTFLVIRMGMSMTGAYLALTYFDSGAGLITIGMILATFALIMRFDRVLAGQYRELSRAENRIAEKIQDVVTNITTVVILRIQNVLSKSVAKKMAEPFALYSRNARLNEAKWFLVSLNAKIMTVLVMGYYLWSHVNAGMTILLGTVYGLYGFSDRVAEEFYHFASLYGDFLKQRASVMNAEELAADFHLGKPLQNTGNRTEWNELRVESLTFSYDADDEEGDAHLDDVNFCVKRGERIALIGETGSGKTTLLKVIRELYHPRDARVYLDDQLLPDGFGSISSEITLVPQEPEIFATTIWDNITLGVDHEMGTVQLFADMARFTSVVEALPKRFDSSIKEKGINLSGGEKQRLALARGLLACDDKSIVLLDEPTSSVDINNEMAIYQNIFAAFGTKAVVSSVHHLHLLPLFNRIYLFSNGRISATGTLAQLLEESEQFRQMWTQYREVNAGDTVA